MSRKYYLTIFTYLIAQLSGFVGIPFLIVIGMDNAQAMGWWFFISFLAALLIILILLKEEIQNRHLNSDRVSRGNAVKWALLGILLAYAAQIAAANIELYLFGIEPGSENTQTLIELSKAAPIVILVICIIGPILEEIIFRKIIFGSLYKRTNFVVAALISSFVFAVVHQEFSHILIYASMGLTFAYLYVKTNRIIVPIIAHISMNSIAVILNLAFADKIMELERKLNELQFIIGGLF